MHRLAVPRTCNSWTAASRNAKLSCAQPVTSKQPRFQSCELPDLGCHAASCLLQTKSIMWMNWNGGSSISGAVLNSRFLPRLLTSGEEDMLKKDISSTACKLTVPILSISVTFNVTCLKVTSFFNYEIMPATLANTFLFILQGIVHYQIWGIGLMVDLGYTWSQLISVYNSERIIKIGQYFPKLCSNEKGSCFFLTHSVYTKCWQVVGAHIGQRFCQ